MRAVVLVLIAACGRIGFSERTGGDAADTAPDAACTFGPWTPPVRHLEISSNTIDNGPTLSPDGTSLYFHSSRPGTQDLFFASRADPSGSFDAPVAVTGVNTDSADRDPSLVGDHLYFSSDRAGGESIYVATLTAPGVVGAVDELVELGVGSFAPHVTSDELEMFYSDGNAMFHATRASTTVPWQVQGTIDELDGNADDGYATMADDNLTIFFETSRNGTGQIFTATRPARDQPFGAPTRVVELDLAGTNAADPAITLDGRTMVFGSDRDTPGAGNDLFISTRSCL